jgi:hypothetical protein
MEDPILQDDEIRNEGKQLIYIIGPMMLSQKTDPFVAEVKSKVGDSIEVEYVDSDGQNGDELCEEFDLEQNQLPAVLILEEDHSIYKSWYGPDLPDSDQVSYEASQLTGRDA